MKPIEIIQQSLAEDTGSGDMTTHLLIPNDQHGQGTVLAKESGIFFGGPVIDAFNALVPDVSLMARMSDGQSVVSGDVCLSLIGNYREILRIERTLLNLIQRLSGIATTTRQFVRALNQPSIQVLDTRKTTPLLRELEKKAVVAGGGYNHRFGLFDMVLVKENHLVPFLASNSMQTFNQRLNSHKQAFPNGQIEVEVSCVHVLKDLELSNIDMIMCDNMTMPDIHAASQWIRDQAPHCLIEVSGNITMDCISAYRDLPIDRISVGALTHSVQALDVSLLMQ